jgi:Tfp pilus assembly protein PilV
MNTAMTPVLGPAGAPATRPRRFPDPGDEAGFGLIEGIVAAVIFAILALGVLAAVDGAARSTGREKARAVASTLAERDQERMRTMRAVDLPEYRWTRDVTIGDAVYTVASEADWVSDTSASDISCTSTGGKADFLRLRSTVTSTAFGTSTASARIDSLMTPPIGSAGGNNGTLSVQVSDRDNKPVAGIGVSISGEDAGFNGTKPTNANGCAVFAYVPADTYDIVMNTTSYVSTDGVQSVATTGTVTTGTASVVPLVYDKAGALTASFDTQYYDWAANAYRVSASRAFNLTLANARLSTNAGRRFLSSATPVAQLGATNLFPFADGYGVYAGRCVEENPSAFNSAWASTSGNAFLSVDRGANATMTVRQPALPVRVANGQTGSGASAKWNWVGGADVRAKLVVASTSDCAASPDRINGITTGDSASGLQSYPSGITPYSGTVAQNYADGWLGFVTKKEPGTTGTDAALGLAPGSPRTWSTRYFDPGLPWGTWQICADDGSRRSFVTVNNKNRAGTANYIVLDLKSATSATGTCSGINSWPAPTTPQEVS